MSSIAASVLYVLRTVVPNFHPLLLGIGFPSCSISRFPVALAPVQDSKGKTLALNPVSLTFWVIAVIVLCILQPLRLLYDL